MLSTNTKNAIESNKNYVQELAKIKLFANASFYQIDLDIPRYELFQHDLSTSLDNE